MGQDLPLRPLAVYLHIPFCLSRCGYCSFFSLPFRHSALAGYLGYLRREIALFQGKDPSLASAATLYFGGGTPSLLSPEDINPLCSCFDLADGAEVTLEINPLQITSEYLNKLRATPVNRLSIGVQSLDGEDLAYLDRRHKAAQIPAKIKLCRDFGYGNLSLDLIYGLPDSSPDSLRRNLDRFIALAPEHISAYLLTLDDSSPLSWKVSSGQSEPLPGEDNLAGQYAALREGLLAAGFEQYEISNFCRPGRASRHNLAYWKSSPYLGLGASASGWMPPFRYSNPASLPDYYRQIADGKILPEAEECGPDQAAADFLMMGLRLLEGIDPAEYQRLFGTDLLLSKQAEIAKLNKLGLIELAEGRLRLTPAALFISNAVIAELL